MGREECREAIEGPASVMGFAVEAALVNRLLNDLATFAPWNADDSGGQAERLSRRADQLPLMQHVLNRLWIRAATEAGGQRVELKLADYESLGGVAGALDAHGREVLASLGAGASAHVEQIFRALVSGTSVGEAVRRPCRLGELIEIADGAETAVAQIVDAFSTDECNFLRVSERAAGADMIVDISHESLIRQWKPLSEWLEKEIKDDDVWRRLVAAEERYAQGEGGLLTGLDLQNLGGWWESASPSPAWSVRHCGKFEEVQSYLAESRRVETQQRDAERVKVQRERNRIRAGGIVAICVLLALQLSSGEPRLFWSLFVYAVLGAEMTAISVVCGRSKPWWLLPGTAAITALLAIVLAGTISRLEDFFTFHTGTVVLPLGPGILEELLKAMPIFAGAVYGRVASLRRRSLGVRDPLDGILIGSASAIGFLLYFFLSHDQGDIIITRLVFAASGHIAFSGCLGYFVGLAAVRPGGRAKILLAGALFAFAMHSAYNFFAFRGTMLGSIFIGLVTYAAFIIAILKARDFSAPSP
jgi:RsiW-degrading membrane proteinase PrsW (M82 family)